MTGELRRTLPATQDAIESFCWDFQQWLGPEVSSKIAFASELLLREALVNAVEHGCQGIEQAHVQCVVRGRNGRLLIAVTDPGPGFNWQARWHSEPEASSTSGRGILIYRTYAQRIRFNRVGNSLVLTMRTDGTSKA